MPMSEDQTPKKETPEQKLAIPADAQETLNTLLAIRDYILERSTGDLSGPSPMDVMIFDVMLSKYFPSPSGELRSPVL